MKSIHLERRKFTGEKCTKITMQKHIQKSRDADCDKPYWVSLFFDWINASLKEMHFEYLCNHTTREKEKMKRFFSLTKDRWMNAKIWRDLFVLFWRKTDVLKCQYCCYWMQWKTKMCSFTMKCVFDEAAPKIPIATFCAANIHNKQN